VNSEPLAGVRRRYGAPLAHLLVLLACFALTGYVVSQLVSNPALPRMLAWFAGAIVAHDLVAFPIYAFLDRSVSAGVDARDPATPARWDGAVNHLRVPAAGSLLLLVVFLPGIIRQGAPSYHAATGQTQQPFLTRWLLLTAVFFALSAAVFLVRRIVRYRGRRGDPG
jgi:hypothetical protein